MRILYVILTLLLLSSCGPETLYYSSETVPEKWSQNEPVSFEFDVTDTINAYDIILDIKHDQTYKFLNLYTQFITHFPDGERSESVTSLDFKTLNGKSLGKCSGEYCNVSFKIQDKTYFKMTGIHILELYQYSRHDTISGIHQIILSIQKSE